MADAQDLKSWGRDTVRVRVPPPVLLILLLLALPVQAEPYRFSHLREGDRVEMRDRTVMVYSRMGIGQLTLRPTQEWPRRLTLRFCYKDGRGMDRMESLRLVTDALTVNGSFRNTTRLPFSFKGHHQRGGEIEVRFSLVDGALELELPEGFADHSESVTVHWVDVFR